MQLFLDYDNGLGEQSLNCLLPFFEPLRFTPEAPGIDREAV
ncbi:UNVERIFIED_CONTAM: phage tail family protein, partial [Bacillus sp. ATCC 13368]